MTSTHNELAAAVAHELENAQPAELTNGWPEPEPITTSDPEDPPPLSLDMLPETLAPYLQDVAERMNAPLDYAAVSAIAFSGSIIGSRCAIHPKGLDNWKEVPNLWGIIVGPPSMKKTPVVSEIQNTALGRLEDEARREFKKAKTDEKAKTAVINEQAKEAKKLAKRDPVQALEKLAQLEAEKEEAQAVLKRYSTSDATHEALTDIAAENPQGLMVFSDELAGTISQWERKGREGARAFFLQAWNGKHGYQADRVGKGHKSIDRLCLSLFGTMQPDRVKDILRATEDGGNDGLSQRFQLVTVPKTPPYKYVDRKPNEAAAMTARNVFYSLAHLEPLDFGAEAKDDLDIPAFRFDNEAAEIFANWFKDLETVKLNAKGQSPIMAQHLSKFRSLMPCLALIFHLIEMAEVNDPARYSGPIPARHAQMAIRWIDYLEAHARVFYELGHATTPATQILADKMAQLPTEFSIRDIQRRKWGNLRDKAQIVEALNDLEDHQWIAQQTVETKGRPAVRYTQNPRCDGKT